MDLSIAWSGWKDVGIAWRNEYLKENFEEIGLNLIEPERGADEFINLLEGKTNASEIIVSKGLGRALARADLAPLEAQRRPPVEAVLADAAAGRRPADDLFADASSPRRRHRARRRCRCTRGPRWHPASPRPPTRP